MNKDILRRPFAPEQVKQRKGYDGKSLSYVPTSAVIARLNEGLDAWSFEVVRHEVLEEEVVVVGKLVADGVVKMHFGGSSVTRDRTGRCVSIADDLKAAGSDALKKSASLLGVGLELYGGTKEHHVDATRGPSADPRGRRELEPPRLLEPGDRLTQRQLAAIHSAARRKNMERGALLRLIHDRTGKGQPESLSRREASDVITALAGSNGHG